MESKSQDCSGLSFEEQGSLPIMCIISQTLKVNRPFPPLSTQILLLEEKKIKGGEGEVMTTKSQNLSYTWGCRSNKVKWKPQTPNICITSSKQRLPWPYRLYIASLCPALSPGSAIHLDRSLTLALRFLSYPQCISKVRVGRPGDKRWWLLIVSAQPVPARGALKATYTGESPGNIFLRQVPMCASTSFTSSEDAIFMEMLHFSVSIINYK